ncbi:golgin A3 [Cichlidogyrus casuarinus]|uniref:Golgin A3 n=1 Tax=Cichlidogyrus casuarinus TaxID=1844966 RepID=A0ABD2Q6Q2_9PLAT
MERERKTKPLDTVINFDEEFIADISSNEESIQTENARLTNTFNNSQQKLVRYQPDLITMIREKAPSTKRPSINRRNKNRARDTTPVAGRESPQEQSSDSVSETDILALLDDTALDSGMEEHSLAEEDKLRLRNSRLEGKLSAFDSLKCWLEERVSLSNKVASLEGQLKSSRSILEQSMNDSELSAKQLMLAKHTYEKQIQSLSQELQQKNRALSHVQRELTDTRENKFQLQTQLEQRQQSNASQDTSLQHLKEKIKSLFTELEQIKNRLMARLREGVEKNHQLSHENGCLHSQLVVAKSSCAEAKRLMSRQLDALRNEMLASQSMYEKMSEAREQLEQENLRKTAQLQELTGRLGEMTDSATSLENRLEQMDANCRESLAKVSTAEEAKQQLETRITQLEDQLLEQSSLVQEHQQSHDDLLLQLDTITTNSQQDQSQIAQLQSQLDELQTVLQQANEDKQSLASYLDSCKQELQTAQLLCEQSKVEIEERKGEVEALRKSEQQWMEEKESLQKELHQKALQMEALQEEKASIDEALAQIQLENERLEKELTALREDFASRQQEMRADFERQLSQEQEKHESEKAQLMASVDSHLKSIDSLNAQLRDLCELREQLRQLQTSHKALSSDYSSLKGEKEAKEQELTRQLQSVTEQYALESREKESRIDRLEEERVRQVAELQSLAQRMDQLESAKLNALQEQDADWSKKLADVENLLTTAHSSKLAVEAQLDALREESDSSQLAFEQRIGELEDHLRELRSEADKHRQLEEKHKKLLVDVEGVKGKQSGLQQAYETLRQHAHKLEKELDRKETSLAELASRDEFAQRKIDYLSQSSKSSSPLEEEEIQPVSMTLVTSEPPQLDLVSSTLYDSVCKERDLHAESAGEAAKEASETAAQLEILRMEHSSCATQLDSMQQRQQALTEDKSQLGQELTSTKNKVDCLATNEHVEQLRGRVEEADTERRSAEAELAIVRGSMQGLVERYSAVDGMVTMPVSELRELLRGAPSITLTKPLHTVDEYLRGIQLELSQMEQEIVTHNYSVHDSVDYWKRLHQEFMVPQE